MFPKRVRLKSGEQLIIREAQKKDASALIGYVRSVVSETDFLTRGAGEFNKTNKEEEKIIEEHANASNSIFLIAELNGKIVGILNASGSDRPRLKHIVDFGVTVRKEHWGKSIGTRLMQSMIDWAKISGVIRKINLKVQTNNKTAIKLYKKFYFKKEGRMTRDSYINGKFYDDYCMGLLVD